MRNQRLRELLNYLHVSTYLAPLSSTRPPPAHAPAAKKYAASTLTWRCHQARGREAIQGSPVKLRQGASGTASRTDILFRKKESCRCGPEPTKNKTCIRNESLPGRNTFTRKIIAAIHLGSCGGSMQFFHAFAGVIRRLVRKDMISARLALQDTCSREPHGYADDHDLFSIKAERPISALALLPFLSPSLRGGTAVVRERGATCLFLGKIREGNSVTPR